MNTLSLSNGFENKKSLSEQVNEIINGRGSRRSKVQALIKLGIRENEVSFILPAEHREPRHRFTFTFGVEIECVMPHNLFREVANRRGVDYNFERYNHTDNREYFKFTTDSSIGRTPNREGDPIECVSPILDGTKAGFDKLEACCGALNEANAYVNRSTGLHVHIGAGSLTDEQYVNVFINYQKMQNLISSFLAPSRRNAYYAAPITGFDFSRCITKSDVYNKIRSRYYSVNPCSYGAHGTIEFRQHQGSTNFTKIKHWVNFCAKLVAWSMNNVFTSEVTAIDDVPFLTATEKRYFKSRISEFATAVAA